MITCNFQYAQKHFILQMTTLGVTVMIFQFYLLFTSFICVPQVPV